MPTQNGKIGEESRYCRATVTSLELEVGMPFACVSLSLRMMGGKIITFTNVEVLSFLYLCVEGRKMENRGEVIEYLFKKPIWRLDFLSVSQRFLMQHILLQIKNGHTHKFTYGLCFKKLGRIRNAISEQLGYQYSYEALFTDFKILNESFVEYENDKGLEDSFTWITNLRIDVRKPMVQYNLVKSVNRYYVHTDGKKFIIGLLDLIPLQDHRARRLFRFLTACNNSGMTTHRVSDLIRYFETPAITSGKELEEQVMLPAMKDIMANVLFTFKRIEGEVVEQKQEEYFRIYYMSYFRQAINIKNALIINYGR